MHVSFSRAVEELTASWSPYNKLSREFWAVTHSTPVLCATCCTPTGNTFPIWPIQVTSSIHLTDSSLGFSWFGHIWRCFVCVSLCKQTAQPVSNPPEKPVVEQDGSTAESEDEEGDGSATRGRRKAVPVSYSCDWCGKTFDFKCRLIKHKKVCALSPGKEQRCSECSVPFPTLKSLHQHCAEAHGGPPAKKKKTDQVSCDMCDKTFKHSSGAWRHLIPVKLNCEISETHKI